MRARLKVYDGEGQVHHKLDFTVRDEAHIEQLIEDIEGFLQEQYFELLDQEGDEDDE